MRTLRKRWIRQAATVLVLLLTSSGAAFAEPARIALVIGNDTYTSPAFDNLDQSPTLDARAMASKLRGLGFEVINPAGDGEPVLDADLDQLEAALERFSSRLAERPGALALVYYSGHGVTAKADRNAPELTYLVPVRTRLTFEHEARSKAISLDEIVDELRALDVGTGVIIFDACRNTALKSHFRSGNLTRGARLPSAEPPDGGLLVAFSTAAGEVAANRPGKMSIYTEALVRHLGTPGLDLAQTFVRVNGEVMQQIGQRPALRADVRQSLPVLVAGQPGKQPSPEPLPPIVTGPGTLEVVSTPAGAEVRLDGALVGRTPLKREGLSPDRAIQLEVRAAGYEPFKETVMVPPRGVLPVEVVMRGKAVPKPSVGQGPGASLQRPTTASSSMQDVSLGSLVGHWRVAGECVAGSQRRASSLDILVSRGAQEGTLQARATLRNAITFEASSGRRTAAPDQFVFQNCALQFERQSDGKVRFWREFNACGDHRQLDILIQVPAQNALSANAEMDSSMLGLWNGSVGYSCEESGWKKVARRLSRVE